MNDEKRRERINKRGISILKRSGKRFRLTTVDEDKADIRAANRAIKEGNYITLEQLKAELGL